MKRNQLYSWASPLIISLFVTACTKTANVPKNEETVLKSELALSGKPATTKSATGGGTTMEEGARSTFTFNASKTGTAAATGSLNYHFRLGNFDIKGDVTGLEIAGTAAKISGKITEVRGTVPTDYQFVTVGKNFFIRVEDIGEGRGQDKIGDLVVYSTPTTTVDSKPYLKIDGNIQVR